jgi:predicted DNA-binding transcriptional regulator AlpA
VRADLTVPRLHREICEWRALGKANHLALGNSLSRRRPLRRHPSQLYEAMLERPILSLALWCLFRLTSKPQRPGLLSGGFILGYGVFRFLVEYVREPDQQLVGFEIDGLGLSPTFGSFLFGDSHTNENVELRLRQVMQQTGLKKTKLYELQKEGAFPMRIQVTSHSVGWIEEEVNAWIAGKGGCKRAATQQVRNYAVYK